MRDCSVHTWQRPACTLIPPLSPSPALTPGLPKDNAITRCEPNGGTSCYFLNTTAQTFAQAQKSCKRLGGAYLVAWNDQAEQVGGANART